MLVLDCHWPKLSPLAKLLDWHDDVFLHQTGWHHVHADHPDLFSSAQSRWSAPWWCDRSHYADQHIAPKAAWPDLCWSGVGVPATLQPRVTGLKAEQATCRHFLWTSNKSPQIAGQTFRKPTLWRTFHRPAFRQDFVTFPPHTCFYSLWSVVGAASDPTPPLPVITKILPRKSSTHDVPTSVEIMSQSTSHSEAHKTTAPLPPPPVRRLLSAPSHGGARCSRSSYRVWVSRRTYLEHILTRVFFHTRGHPAPRVIKCLFFRSTQLAIPGVHPASESHSSFTRALRKNWGSLPFNGQSVSELAPLLFRAKMKIGQPQAFLDEEFHGREVLFGLKPLFLAPKMGRPNKKTPTFTEQF